MPNPAHSPIADRLRHLRARDFHFAQTRDTAGTIVALIGVRAHHSVIDIVHLYGEHDATGVRIPATEPDILSPRTTLWRTTGTATEVIDQLLTLPDPDTPLPPRHTGSAPAGCWLPVRPGHRIWIPTTEPPSPPYRRPLR